MVDEADLYLGVFAYRYGYIPTGHDISITEMEYNRAVERNIPRLIFMMHDSHPITGAEIEKGAGAIKIEALKERIGKAQVVNSFKSPEELAIHVINSLSQYRESDLTACDGPPYAYHWGLEAAKAHLSALNAPEPIIPPFDPSKYEPMPDVDIDPHDEYHVGDQTLEDLLREIDALEG